MRIEHGISILQGGMSSWLELINSWIASDKSTRIPISTFQLALQLHGVEVDVEEVECMLANMVYRVSPSHSPSSLLSISSIYLFHGHIL
jgi:hypothetical protein